MGKSTVAINLALGLKDKGYKVGIADLDITGSNVPTMLGMKKFELNIGKRLIDPAEAMGLKVMAVKQVLKGDNNPLLMRGETRGKFVLQIIEKVNWGNLKARINQ